MLRTFIEEINEACVGSGGYIVTFKPERKDEVLEKIVQKCNITSDISLGLKGQYQKTSFTFFKTGKLILHGLNGDQDVKTFIRSLLE
ncbi:MAG: hypothetical protein JSV76_04080 [Candidatus Bathyarchaeota archaeon]|nr:MAG: hypothetical protein JSV76_04080 [Candidatus Bathyarchaeota archaeon]